MRAAVIALISLLLVSDTLLIRQTPLLTPRSTRLHCAASLHVLSVTTLLHTESNQTVNNNSIYPCPLGPAARGDGVPFLWSCSMFTSNQELIASECSTKIFNMNSSYRSDKYENCTALEIQS